MPLRVASLIPSGTEIVSALGMADTLVGRSHCCDYPPEVAELPVLSEPKIDPTRSGAEIDAAVRGLMGSGESVYRILMDPLLESAPDVVITQDHCDACAVSLEDVRQAVACAALAGAHLCALHPHDLDAVTDDFGRVARALGVPARGERLAAAFRARLESVRSATSGATVRPRVALVEWLEPPMVAGGWIPELARIAGLEPVLVEDARSFLEADWQRIGEARPDALVLLPCGFDVRRTLDELGRPEVLAGVAMAAAHAPLGAWVVDGDAYFNRPGPRLADSAELLAALFHPGRAPIAASRFAGAFAQVPLGSPQRTISLPSSRA